MPRPIQAVIDSEAVRYNLARVKSGSARPGYGQW